jgi:hypothetical protein
MLLKNAQPTLRKPLRRDLGSGDHDPAALSSTVRELALRAHQLVRAIDVRKPGPGGGTDATSPSELGYELTELHARIVQLQRKLPAQKFGELALYVSALRQRVEERLA